VLHKNTGSFVAAKQLSDVLHYVDLFYVMSSWRTNSDGVKFGMAPALMVREHNSVGFEVLTSVVVSNQSYLLHAGFFRSLFLDLDDGGDMFLRNVG
jgi:hypothetical protein